MAASTAEAVAASAAEAVATSAEGVPASAAEAVATSAAEAVATTAEGMSASAAEAVAASAEGVPASTAKCTATVSLLDMTLMEKQVVGSLFGSGNPRYDIPKLLNLWREGLLDLDGLVTKTYTLDDVNEGYDDMRAGRNIRGVMVYS